MKRYTLVLHPPIFQGWQIIEFKRVRCKPEILQRYYLTHDVHFVIDGWPDVRYPSGNSAFEREKGAK